MPEIAKRVQWDLTGEKTYETGVDHGVLYMIQSDNSYGDATPWNGLTAVNETPSGAEATAIYADNIKYLNMLSVEEFSATIEAYSYPKKFEVCDGSAEVAPGVIIGQQARKTFGFAYRTLIGNDVDGEAHGYKLHLVYGCQASPSERSYGTVSDSPDAISFSWEINTTPVNVTGYKATSIMTIDSTLTPAEKMADLEDILYGKDPTSEGGSDGVAGRLPYPDEVIALMTTAG